MAHFTKYKHADAKRIINEALRKQEYYKNEVDITRSRENIYSSTYEEIKAKYNKKLKDNPPKRKNQVILINEIITRPEDLKEGDENIFYSYVLEYNYEYLKLEPLYYAIHNDEMTQHMHLSYFAYDTKAGKWNARDLLNREKLLYYHKGLQEYMDKKLGYHVQIEKDRKTEHLSFTEYKEAMRREREKQK